MSKLANLYLKDQAFKLYSTGMKPADIAKELNITPNTLSTWKTNDKWDEKVNDNNLLPPSHNTNLAVMEIDNKDLVDQIKLKIATALLDPNIKPNRWRDILETLQFLSAGAPNKGHKGKGSETDVTNLNDTELDKEISQLSRLAGEDEVSNEAEIVIPKRDVVEVE